MRTAVLALDPTFVATFEGDTIDSSVWNVWGRKHDTYVGFDAGVIRGAEVTQKDGNLVVSMTRRETPKVFGGSPGVSREWDTGWVSLQPAYGFTYGAYEVEALIPAAEDISAGVWCGVWSRPYGGKTGGEIDVAESFGHNGREAKHSRAEGFTSTVHFDQSGKNHRNALSPVALKPLSTTFHKYGVLKTAEEVVFYFDREEIFRVKRSEDPAAFDKAFPAGVPFDIRFCIQAGGKWGGWPTEATAPRSELLIRKVTVWDFERQ